MFKIKSNLVMAFLLQCSFMVNGQTLPTPDFKELPCYGQSGLTHFVELYPVAGADGYLWYSPGGASLSINGMLSPVTTTIPTANITYIQPDSIWKLCVSAFSSCCSSSSNCQFIYNAVPMTFWPANSTTAYPNTTDVYGIYFNCLPLISSITIYWSLNGDITFSNGQQSITSDSSTLHQTLTFGPGFTSGSLCVYTVNSSGAATPPMCMNIVNPTGIGESFTQGSLLFYNYTDHTLYFTEAVFTLMEELVLYDVTGKKIFELPINNLTNNMVRLPDSLNKGLYAVYLTGNQQTVSGKILVR